MGEEGGGVVPPTTITGSGGATNGGCAGTDIGSVIAGAGGVPLSSSGDGAGSSGGDVESRALISGGAAGAEDMAIGLWIML